MPPRGWHYPQVLSSGQTITIAGFSFEQLLDNIGDFRNKHLELCGGAAQARLDSIIADVRNYFCAHFKQNCAGAHTVPQARVGIGLANYVTPIDKASNWLARIASARLERVDPAVAAQRAQTCAQCPLNVHWATPCQSCNDNILARSQMAKGNFATPYDRHLFTCRLYGHLNEIAVWLRDTHSTAEQRPPACCWKGNNGK